MREETYNGFTKTKDKANDLEKDWITFLWYRFFYTSLRVCLAYLVMKYVRLEPYLFPFHAFALLTLTVNEVWIPDMFQDGNIDINGNETTFLYVHSKYRKKKRYTQYL